MFFHVGKCLEVNNVMLLCFSRLMVRVALACVSARVVFTCKFKIKSRKTIDLAPFFSLLPHFFSALDATYHVVAANFASRLVASRLALEAETKSASMRVGFFVKKCPIIHAIYVHFQCFLISKMAHSHASRKMAQNRPSKS